MILRRVCQKTQAKLDEWDHIKLKHCCIAKKVNRVKRQPTKWEGIFTNCSSHRGVISREYIKNSINK
jgi:hypothetical protein